LQFSNQRQYFWNILLSRFEVQFILSEPAEDWVGKRGKISSALLSECMKRSKKDSKVLICICGPTPFTEQGIQ